MKYAYLVLSLLVACGGSHALEQEMPLPADISSLAPQTEQPKSSQTITHTINSDTSDEDDFQDDDQEELSPTPTPITLTQQIDYTPILKEISNELSEIKKSVNELIEFKRPHSAQESMIAGDSE